MIIDQFSLWASFNLNFLPFQVINLRILNLREYFRSLERIHSGFIHINKKKELNEMKFLYFLGVKLSLWSIWYFSCDEFAGFFLWAEETIRIKTTLYVIHLKMVKTAFNFSFYGQWSFLCWIYHLLRKKAHPSIFLTKFPFRWHFRNEFNDGVISNFLIYLPWEFNSQNRLLFSIANDVFKMMRTKKKLEIIAKSRKYQRLISYENCERLPIEWNRKH